MATKIVMPDLGESVIEGTILCWHKAVGDTVKTGDVLLEVDTDKVTTEITASADGVLLQIAAQAKAVIDVGSVLGYIGASGELITAAAPATSAHQQASSAISVKQAPQTQTSTFVSPVVARMVAYHQLDIKQMIGTGKNGRVRKKDVEAFLAAREAEPAAAVPAAPIVVAPTAPVAPPAVASAENIIALSPMRRAIADHMVRSVQTSPHVTSVVELDLTAIGKHRAANMAAFAADGVKLTYTAYFMVAVAQALKTHRFVNASWTDNGIQLHSAVHLGMATDLGDKGLIVPVVRDASDLSLRGMARTMGDLAARARSGDLRPAEVRGGTFTLTNYGANRASLLATPIINQPQCAIMGIGKIERRPVVRELAGEEVIVARTMCYASLTYDHRILDGGKASRFWLDVIDTVENWA